MGDVCRIALLEGCRQELDDLLFAVEILREIAAGASNKEIARSLAIAETTVKIHVQHILRKLGLSSRVQAAVLLTEGRGRAGG